MGDAEAMRGSATRAPSVLRVARAGPRLSAHALQILGERHLLAIHVDGGFQGRSHPGVAGQCSPLGRWQRVVGVPGNSHRLRRPAERVADDRVVPVRAHEDAHGRCVPCRVAKAVIDGSDVETKLPGGLGFELANHELNDDVSNLWDVEKQQVDVEVITANVEVNLLPDEGETRAELEQGVAESRDQGLLEVALGDSA